MRKGVFLCLALLLFSACSMPGHLRQDQYERSKLVQRWQNARVSNMTIEGHRVRIERLFATEDGLHQMRLRYSGPVDHEQKSPKDGRLLVQDVASKIMADTCGIRYKVIRNVQTSDAKRVFGGFEAVTDYSIREYAFACVTGRFKEPATQQIYAKWQNADTALYAFEGHYIKEDFIKLADKDYEIRLRLMPGGESLPEEEKRSLLNRRARIAFTHICGGIPSNFVVKFSRPTSDVHMVKDVHGIKEPRLLERSGVYEYGLRCLTGNPKKGIFN